MKDACYVVDLEFNEKLFNGSHSQCKDWIRNNCTPEQWNNEEVGIVYTETGRLASVVWED